MITRLGRVQLHGVTVCVALSLISVNGVAATSAAVSQEAPDREIDFDIPVNAMDAALMSFADQADVQIAMRSQDLQGLKSHSVAGRYTPQYALTALIDGEPVIAAWTSASTVSVRAARSQRIAYQVAEPSSEPAPAGEAPVSSGLEEIVVTAQRRTENLQQVPLAITAITAPALEASGISAVQELVVATPGVMLNSDRYALVPYIRGIGSQNTTPGDEGAVSIYVDNVLYAEAGANVFSFNNIERVEVLRGPQGTLFGRNALGGLINIITRKPAKTPLVQGSVSYGNYDTLRGSVYASSGLTDNLAMDFAASGVQQNDGWGHNPTLNIPVDRNKEYSLRSKLLAELGAATTLTVTGDYTRANSDIGVSRGPAAGTRAITGLSNAGFYDISTEDPPLGRKRQYGVSATLESGLGFADLTSITAYRHYQLDVRGDADGTATFVTVSHLPMRNKTFQQEFVLNGEQGILKWTSGLFYFSSDASYENLAVVSAVPSRSFSLFSSQGTDSYAAYAQGALALTASTNLTLGARYTIDKRTIDAKQYALASYPNTAPGALTNSTDNLPRSQTHRKFNKLTWRVALDQQLSTDVLGYVSASRGFKSGVFATASPFNPAVAPSTLDAYELGLKSDLFDRTLRLNVAAFYYQFDNIQLQAINPGFVGAFLLNAADARSHGVDLEAVWAPRLNDGSLQLRGSASVLDAKYQHFPNSVITTPLPGGGNLQSSGDASGNWMIQAPQFTSSLAIDYSHPLGNEGALSVNLTWMHNDGFYWDSQNRTHQGAYNIVNGRLAYSGADAHWSIALFGRNVLDKKYYASMSPQTNGDIAVPAAPRTYGIEFQFKLGGH